MDNFFKGKSKVKKNNMEKYLEINFKKEMVVSYTNMEPFAFYLKKLNEVTKGWIEL